MDNEIESAQSPNISAAEYDSSTIPRWASKSATRREFIKGAAAAGAAIAALPALSGKASASTFPPASGPGAMRSWQQLAPIYSGTVNLSTGNAQIVLPICNWDGLGGGLQFSLVFNSQSTRTSPVGPGWTHSYRWMIFGGPQTTVIADDGTEMLYTYSNGVFTPPAGCYDALTHNSNGTWTLVRKGGVTYQFNSSGLLTSITDLSGNQTSIGYNAQNNIATITDAANRTITLGYSTGQGSSPTIFNTLTDCVGRVWYFSWAGVYNDVQVIYDPPVNGNQYYRQIGYDSNWNVNAITDRLGKVWHYNYSGTTFLSATDPDSHSWSLAYGTLDTGISWPATAAVQANWTNSRSNVAKYALDTMGRPVGIYDATYLLTTQTWDTSNNRTSTISPSGAQRQWGYDNRGNITLETDPFSKQTTKTYDYNNGDKLNYVKDPLGYETFYNYPTVAPFNGNLLSVKDARGNITSYTYWAGGLVKKKTDAENRVLNYTYDQWGHPYQTTIVKDASTSFVTTTVYSKNSLLTQRTDARNRVTNYTYDNWSRLTQKAYPTSGRTSVVLTLDANGRITQAVDATGTRTFNVFDSWGRCKSMNDPKAGSNNPLLASYDGEGNLLTQKDVTGRTLAYSYDADNRLITISDDGNATQAVITYDPDGNKQTITMPNGTLATWTYISGRLVSVTHTRTSDNSVIASYNTNGTSFDAGGRLLNFTDNTGDVTTFGYDQGDNLLNEARTGSRTYSGAYTYDKTNWRKTALTVTNGITSHNGAYTYDGAGWLSQVIDAVSNPATNEAYAWYSDGTLSSYPHPTQSGVTVLPDYDEEGNLIQLNHLSGGATTTAYQYGYAYDGKRRWKKDYANNASTWYPCGVACSAGELAELTSDLTGQNWNTSALYLPGGIGDGSSPIRRRDISGGIATNDEYHHANLLGVNGTITDANAVIYTPYSNTYDAFGVVRPPASQAQIAGQNAVLTPYRFLRTNDDALLQGNNAQVVSLAQRSSTTVVPDHWQCVQCAVYGPSGIHENVKDCLKCCLTAPCGGQAQYRCGWCCQVRNGGDPTSPFVHCTGANGVNGYPRGVATTKKLNPLN